MTDEYSGLTRFNWPGTWTTADGSKFPIVLSQDIRGSIHRIEGGTLSNLTPVEKLTDIPGQRLEEGMLVYVKYAYVDGLANIAGDTYYRYKSIGDPIRDGTGALPNAIGNWIEFTAGDGSGSGSGEVNNLVFTADLVDTNKRKLTAYKESGITYSVRKADLLGDMFNLTLASFTPTFNAAGVPSSTLSWDSTADGFSVQVINPSDFPSEYISSVASVLQQKGNVSNLGNFDASAITGPLTGTWSQTFNVDANSFIYSDAQSDGSTLAGGESTFLIKFNVTQTAGATSLYSGFKSLTISWLTPTVTISTTPLSGKTFLDAYQSTGYTISISGVKTVDDHPRVITPNGGDLIDNGLSGTFRFTNVVHKDNINTPVKRLDLSTTFVRPVNITGVAYQYIDSKSAGISATFTYPSFHALNNISTDLVNPPTREDLIAGNAFNPFIVTELPDRVKTLSKTITNTQDGPRKFWFGILASASQPTTFLAGASAALLSNVEYVGSGSGSDPAIFVSLFPEFLPIGIAGDSDPAPITVEGQPPAGYTPVSYRLYGITLQPGNTYISIS
jgi:hypothetical protein